MFDGELFAKQLSEKLKNTSARKVENGKTTAIFINGVKQPDMMNAVADKAVSGYHKKLVTGYFVTNAGVTKGAVKPMPKNSRFD